MFINSEIIAIMFRLINFIAIIGALFFIFQKYGKARFLARIQQEKDAHQALRTQQLLLERQQAQLDALSKQDALACEKLKSNIDEWKKFVTLEHDTQLKKHTLSIESLKAHKINIKNQKEERLAQSMVIKAVATNIEKSLTQHFSDPQKNSAYLEEIVNFMKRKTS